MDKDSVFWRSFNGGEMSPDSFGKIDDPKYLSGLATCKDWIPLPHGPARVRPGFKFVRAAKNSNRLARLMPFTYSNDQTMVLEMGHLYVRFHTQGATLLSGGSPYEVVTPYNETHLEAITYVQSYDVMTMAHPVYPVQELRRLSSVSWTMLSPTLASTLSPPTTASVVATRNSAPTNQRNYEYAITSVDADGIEESQISNSASGGTLTITGVTAAGPGVFTMASIANVNLGQRVRITGVVGMTELNNNTYRIGSVDNGGGGWYDDYYGYYVPGTPTQIRLVNEDGTDLNTSSFTAYVSGGTMTLLGVSNNLQQDDTYNSISWPTAVSAAYYNVYRLENGTWGFIGQTTFTGFRDDNITPDMSRTPPLADNPFGSSNNYPSAVSYFEQRRVFAGTYNGPLDVEMTKAGTESNFDYSIPTRDDDSIGFTIKARQAARIQHLAPLADLIALTASGEWRISSRASDLLTPNTVSARNQSYIGASPVQPQIVNTNLIYVAARGGHLRELSYNDAAAGYITGDMCLRATHLFNQYEIVDLAYSKSPVPIIWAVSSSGLLLSLTYVPEEKVGAWAKHETDGFFESCCVVSEGDEDVLYVVVRRTINGSTVRYIERMNEMYVDSEEDDFYVDCGVTVTGSGMTSISGLTHLEGEEVVVVADGAVQTRKTVVGGAITLDSAADKVHVGLPYTPTLVTLPSRQLLNQNVDRAFIRLYDSVGLQAGPSTDLLEDVLGRNGEDYGYPADPQTKVAEVKCRGEWNNDGTITIVQTQPRRATVVAVALENTIGG